MIGQIARRTARPAAKRLTQQRRTMFDNAGPNTINEQQRAFQKGSTPYLRGDADPTFLRKSSDAPIVSTILAFTALGWAMCGYNHFRMWNNYK
mmetsp:Transcript_2920/g.4193  ORF Transcript_2920/g.4193 Transcript_2920/m.4193 type:complete len:93 (+) Transcript_2920:63-341(+)